MTLSVNDAARFWSKVDATGDCWLWTASVGHNGYGQFSVGGRAERQMARAHRLAYELLVGPIGDMTLDHLCRVRHCVNPDHLEAVTRGENLRRGAHPSMVAFRAGTCQRGHPRTPDHRYANGRCRTCRKATRPSRTQLRERADYTRG